LEHWEEIPSINTTNNVLRYILKQAYNLVVHIGDIAYAVGFSAQWDEFMDQIAPVASRVPYMTLPGNHERDYINSGSYFSVNDSYGECGVPYENRFLMPTTSHTKQWYSFNYGNIHFVMMSTEINFTVGSEQYLWLENDLMSVDRSVSPWLIFAGHRPMYIDSTDVNGPASDIVVSAELKESLEPLLVQYQVDLALWGHHHSYQRTCPIEKDTCFYGGKYPVHCVIGMAGMGLSQNLPVNPPSWLEYVDDQEYGYSTIETTEKYLRLQFHSNAGELRDELYIYA